MATFHIKHIEKRKIFFLYCSPPRAPTNPFAGICVTIFYILYANGVLGHGGGEEQYRSAKNVAQKGEPENVNWFNYTVRKQIDRN